MTREVTDHNDWIRGAPCFPWLNHLFEEYRVSHQCTDNPERFGLATDDTEDHGHNDLIRVLRAFRG
jgi:hypothetical protein